MVKFTEVMDQNLEKLELYVPVVAKVHGEAHPEFYEIKNIFDTIIKKYKNHGEKENYSDEFKELRRVSNNYIVPKDVCESYEGVYNMLNELDKAYFADK